MEKNSYKRIKSVAIMNNILEYVSRCKVPASAQEISDAVGVPVGTVMCYLETMKDYQYLEQAGDGYRIGMFCAMLWSKVKASLEAEMEGIKDKLKTIRA